MRTVSVHESGEVKLKLTNYQVKALRHLGRVLASRGGQLGSDDVAGQSATVIRCNLTDDGEYIVRVGNVVGVVGLNDLQLIVKPKIPLAHFLFLIRESGRLPRTSMDSTQLDPDDNFFSLIGQWFVAACEEVLRKDLTRDYHSMTSDLMTIRGRVNTVVTMRALMVGRIRIRCSYSHLEYDTALNRLLHFALGVTQSSRIFKRDTRRRARRAQARFGDVGEFQPSDLYATPDSRTSYYRDAANLARMLIMSQGINVQSGTSTGGTFLFPTPSAIEEGIRRLLQMRLPVGSRVEKGRLTMFGAIDREMQPDLVFGDDEAIGDVKYRISFGKMDESHIYQVAAYAAGYRIQKGLLIEFGDGNLNDYANLGDIRIDSLNWDTEQSDPEESAQKLTTAVQKWLSPSSQEALS